MSGRSGFAITISATDKVSGTLDRISRRMATIRAPADRAAKSLEKIYNVSGAEKVAKSLTGIAHYSFDAFRSVSRLVQPMEVLTSAASVAGLIALTSAWAKFGNQLSNTAKNIGVPVAGLFAMQQAAKLANVSSDSLTSSLGGLATTMYNAIGGRDPNANGLFNNLLGNSWKKDATHAKSAIVIFEELADKIAKMNDPQAQARAVQIAGMSTDVLPLMRLGSKGIEALIHEGNAYGGGFSDADVKNAKSMASALSLLDVTAGGVARTIAASLAPVLTPLLLQMSDWLKANKGLIGTDAVEGFRIIAGDVKAVWGEVNRVVTALGGWKAALNGLFILMGASFALSVLSPFTGLLKLVTNIGLALAGIPGLMPAVAAALAAAGIVDAVQHSSTASNDNFDVSSGQMGKQTPAGVKANAATLRSVMKSHGMPDASIAGFFGNFIGESAIDPHRQQPDGPGYGVAQWGADRQADFRRIEGVDIHKSTMAQQADFVWQELHQPQYKKLLADLMSGRLSVSQATMEIDKQYERPKNLWDPHSGIMQRSLFANAYYNGLNKPPASAPKQTDPVMFDGQTASAPEVHLSRQTLSVLDDLRGNDQHSTSTTDIRLHLPKGMDATTTTRASGKPPRVHTFKAAASS